MRRKIEVTASEMMALREQGMSNHDIAKSLGICAGTVVRYIGKQGGRMTRLEAFRDAPKFKKEEAAEQIYCPKPICEEYLFCNDTVAVKMCHNAKAIVIQKSGENVISLNYEQAHELTRFLVWISQKTYEEAIEDG